MTVPAGESVTTAAFSCYSISSNASGAAVHPAGNGWTETGLTWQNRPALQAALGRTGAVTSHAYTPPVTVTSAIQGSGDYTFAMTTPSSTRWSCASRENTGNHPARLTLTFGTGTPSSSTPPSTSSAPPSTSSAPPSTSSAPPSTSSAPPSTSSPPPSTSSAPPPGQHKVLVIPLENHSQSEALAQMPYLAGLANTYGSATNYYAVAHPSLPNYLAIFGGSTFGVTSDCSVGSSRVRSDGTVGLGAGSRRRSVRTCLPGVDDVQLPDLG